MAETRVHPTAEAFSNSTDVYERCRPGFPGAAVEFIWKETGLGEEREEPFRVVDLACGTGKLTRQLEERTRAAPERFDLCGVEPAPGMRAKFAEVLPGTRCLDGTGDKMPFFGDEEIDVLCVAQAFHWFANVGSLREMHRVLKPNGHLVLIWNMSFWPEFRAHLEKYEDGAPQFRQMAWKEVWRAQAALPEGHPDRLGFSLLESPGSAREAKHLEVPSPLVLDFQSLWGRALSISYISLLPDSEKALLKQKLIDTVSHMYPQPFDEHSPATVEFPNSTFVWIFQKQ